MHQPNDVYFDGIKRIFSKGASVGLLMLPTPTLRTHYCTNTDPCTHKFGGGFGNLSISTSSMDFHWPHTLADLVQSYTRFPGPQPHNLSLLPRPSALLFFFTAVACSLGFLFSSSFFFLLPRGGPSSLLSFFPNAHTTFK